MKKSFYSLLIASMMTFGAVCAQGAEANAQAIVLAVKGAVSATVNGANPTPLKVGDKLSVGTVISTAPGAEADIQVFNGAVATIRSDTTCNLEKLSVTASGGVVTKQTALIDLKVGTIASNIDPAKHNINDYGIRTPKGVAAARGTAYQVTVRATGAVQIFVTTSAVTFTNPTTGQTITVPAGSRVTVSETGVIQPPVQMTSAEFKQAKEEGKPVDPNNVTITTQANTNNNNNNSNPSNNNNPPPVLDVTSPSS